MTVCLTLCSSVQVANNNISGKHFRALIDSLEDNTGLLELDAKLNQRFRQVDIDEIIEPMAIGCEVYVSHPKGKVCVRLWLCPPYSASRAYEQMRPTMLRCSQRLICSSTRVEPL